MTETKETKKLNRSKPEAAIKQSEPRKSGLQKIADELGDDIFTSLSVGNGITTPEECLDTKNFRAVMKSVPEDKFKAFLVACSQYVEKKFNK